MALEVAAIPLPLPPVAIPLHEIRKVVEEEAVTAIAIAQKAVTARRCRHHLSRTTRVWNVLDGVAQGRLGFWIARREKVLGFGVLDQRRGKVLVAQRGKVLLVLVARREEGSGYGGPRSLYIRVRCCLSCMFLLHATTCSLNPPVFRRT